VPAEVQPPELASLIDFAERARVGDWSLRSALVRYAQPEPERVSSLLEQVRRIEFALHPLAKVLEREGPAVWDETTASRPPTTHAAVVGLLRATMPIDAVADDLAAWADDRTRPRPDAAVDECVTTVAGLLDDLGVAREEQPPGPPRRGGERRR
jgi:hypothetical protein